MNQVQKRILAGRAALLSERLFIGFNNPSEDAAPESKIEQWKSNLGDAITLNDRLIHEEASLEECQRAIATNIWPENHPLPDWIHTFSEILQAASDQYPHLTEDERFIDDGHPVPFEELLSPFVRYTRTKIQLQAPAKDRISETAMEDMERWLLEGLSEIAAQALHVRFRSFASIRRPEVVFGTIEDEKTSDRTVYTDFVKEMFDSLYVDFFHDYTVLARYLSEKVVSWAENTSELYQRISTDFDVFIDEFGIEPTANIVHIDPGLSDHHNGGKTVVKLHFSTGKSIVYKPRDITIEDQFYNLIQSVSQNTAVSDLRTPKCVPRDAYGWIEHVEPQPCSSESDVETYYQRAGEILSILYVLNAVDCHFENIIASGSDPVVIDAETVLHPRLTTDALLSTEQSEELVERVVRNSVLETDFLPWHPSEEESDRADVSGIGGGRNQSSSQKRLVWNNINTDWMDCSYESDQVGKGENIPTLNGTPKHPEEYLDEICKAFKDAYEEIKSDPMIIRGEISEFTDTQVRYIFRGTRLYQSLLDTLTQPDKLRTGVDQSLEIEKLTRPFLSEAQDSERDLWQLYELERSALTQLDVPRFTASTVGTDLLLRDNVVRDVLAESPIATLRDPERELSKEDKQTQLDYIQLSLAQSTTSTWHHTRNSEHFLTKDDSGDTPEYLDLSISIAEDILDQSVTVSDDRLTWVTQDYDPDSGRLRIHSIDDNLYAGRAGIALFFAALAHVSGKNKYERVAVETSQPLIDSAQEIDIEDRSLGCATGIGSIIYAAVRIGELLDRKEIIEIGETLASQLSRAHIHTDDTYDLVGGCAGLLVALLVLYQSRPEAEYLSLAQSCGDHLVNSRIQTSSGHRVWCSKEEPLAGFAHGVSGIAYALFRLYDSTGEDRFCHAAREAIAFEDAVYSPSVNNWPDLRSSVPHQFMDGWCHGRSGIGLARTGISKLIEFPGINQDMRNAAEAIPADELLEDDHVCCGNFSRVAFLSVLTQQLDDTEYRENTDTIVSNVLERAEKRGQLQCLSHTGQIYNPGFFRGTSGIGYSLLRLAAPEKIPSVLLFE